jgi:cyclopropane-fatty-acyl-phospholipid synthase
MSMQNQEAISRSINPKRSLSSSSLAAALLRRTVGDLECGELVIEMPAGNRLVFGGRRPGPQAKVTVHTWRCLWRLVFGWDIGFAESYCAGEWSSPNLVALLELACENSSVMSPLKPLHASGFLLRLRHAMNRNTRRGSRRNIAAHYDLGNGFYQQWLDAGMSYSAGLFSSVGQTLEQAQDAKLGRVLDLLEITGGESVLEIGCGWGALAERLVQRQCNVTAITLSADQLAYAQRRLSLQPRGGSCDLRFQDYRDVSGTFDRIVSIEMLEAVGETYWSTYFEKLFECLKPGGIAVLQVITIDEARFENYRRRPDFIQKYIFPGGMLPTPQIIEREASKAALHLVGNEFFGEGYARTLEDWRIRFQNAWPQIKALGFDERFKRMWEYYLVYCQVGFETRTINVGFYKIMKPACV